MRQMTQTCKTIRSLVIGADAGGMSFSAASESLIRAVIGVGHGKEVHVVKLAQAAAECAAVNAFVPKIQPACERQTLFVRRDDADAQALECTSIEDLAQDCTDRLGCDPFSQPFAIDKVGELRGRHVPRDVLTLIWPIGSGTDEDDQMP